jgi:hypothetical protein
MPYYKCKTKLGQEKAFYFVEASSLDAAIDIVDARRGGHKVYEITEVYDLSELEGDDEDGLQIVLDND